jgi:hypothetical protein
MRGRPSGSRSREAVDIDIRMDIRRERARITGASYSEFEKQQKARTVKAAGRFAF